MSRPPRIFISVAEDSADRHAFALVGVLRKRLPGVALYGLTGPQLRNAGVETIFDLTRDAAMLTGIIGKLAPGWKALRAAKAAWEKSPPDLVIVLDSSALHLPMARRAHLRGIPVLYYIAPQTWASRAYRNRQLERYVDRVACILPFEQAHFRRALVYATYVGHPLFEVLPAERPQETAVQKLRRSGRPVVAVLPGSRRQVIDAMLPRQLEVVRRLRAAGHAVEVGVSCAASDRLTQVRRHVHASGFAAEILVDDNASLLTAADLVLVASGTATLQTAYYRKPMVVMYDAGAALRWIYRLLGRFIIHTPHLALVNILAGERIVPEFMPFVPDTRPVAEVAGALLGDSGAREAMAQRLDAVVRPLEGSRASERVAEMVTELLQGRDHLRE